MRALLVAVALAACGGSGTGLVIDSPFVGDSGSNGPQTGTPLQSGDTITANTDGVEIGAASIGGLAVWVDKATHVAHGAVVDGAAHVANGQAFALPTITDVTEVHPLALADRSALAVGIVSASGGYLVADVDAGGTASAPIALATPSQAACRFAPPDKIMCAGTVSGTEQLGTIAPGSPTVAFGPAHALPPVAFGPRSTGQALLYTDADGCGQIASVSGIDELGVPQALPCGSHQPRTGVVTAIDPMPTSDGAFTRAYIRLPVDAKASTCTFYAFTGELAATQTATGVGAGCPRAVSWGVGLLFGIAIEDNGTALLVSFSPDGSPQPFPNPVLGIGNLIAADVVAGTIGLALVAIADGERIQFAIWNGEPI